MKKDITNKWDWEIGNKKIYLNNWKDSFSYLEEFKVSPDGERVVVIGKNHDGKFSIYDSKKIWDGKFYDKIWNLNFANNGFSYAIVLLEDGWTVAVDGNLWENNFDYIWNLHCVSIHKNKTIIAASIKDGLKYSIVIDDNIWKNYFPSLIQTKMNLQGTKLAGVVQTDNIKAEDPYQFRKKIFTVILNDKVWKNNFLNVWNLSFSHDGNSLAAEVRLDPRNYTIAVNDKIWGETYNCVWTPIFNPKNLDVVAPVLVNTLWGLSINGSIVVPPSFYQFWNLKYNLSGEKLAGIISPKYGLWTVIVNDIPWTNLFNNMVVDLAFDFKGERLSALCKHDNYWYVVVDDVIWDKKVDMAYKPIYSKNEQHIALRVKIGKKYTFLINNKIYNEFFDFVWDPIFNESGEKVMFKTLKNGLYKRSIIEVKNVV